MTSKAIIATCTLLLSTATAGAANFDGSAPMLCAATSSVTCEPRRDCVQGPVENVNLPLFWRFDPVAKTLTGAHAGGERRMSPVSSVGGDDAHLLLQGADAGFGWSATINRKTGTMVVTGGRDEGYIVFGACIAL